MWDLPRPGLEPVFPCISRQILNHCATREAPIVLCFNLVSKEVQTFAGMKVFCMLFVVLVSQVYTSVKNCTVDTLNDVNFISKVDLLM